MCRYSTVYTGILKAHKKEVSCSASYLFGVNETEAGCHIAIYNLFSTASPIVQAVPRKILQ